MDSEKFNNGDLSFEIEKIKSFDAPIVVSKSFVETFLYPFGLDVEDSTYWYANELERDEDYNTLKSVVPHFTFISHDIKILDR